MPDVSGFVEWMIRSRRVGILVFAMLKDAGRPLRVRDSSPQNMRLTENRNPESA